MGSSSSAGAGLGELLGSTQLQTGTLDVAIDLPQGPETAAEVAAIHNAIASLNSQLAPLGVNLVEVSGAEAAAAPIQITMASTTAIGGVDQGVLAAFTAGGDITLVSGWNWYFGSAGSPIAQNQYDFQTVVTHELGHALGLGESADPGSVMYLYLNPGEVEHDLTATDLNAIRQELPASAAPLPGSPVSTVSDPVLPPSLVAPVAEGLSPSARVNDDGNVADAQEGRPWPRTSPSLSRKSWSEPGGQRARPCSESAVCLLPELSPTSRGADQPAEVLSAVTPPLSARDLALQSSLQGSSPAQEVAVVASSPGNEGTVGPRENRETYFSVGDAGQASAPDLVPDGAAVDWLFSGPMTTAPGCWRLWETTAVPPNSTRPLEHARSGAAQRSTACARLHGVDEKWRDAPRCRDPAVPRAFGNNVAARFQRAGKYGTLKTCRHISSRGFKGLRNNNLINGDPRH